MSLDITNTPGSTAAKIVAGLANADVEIGEAKGNEKLSLTINGQTLTEPATVLRALAAGDATLLGQNPDEIAQVEQWLSIFNTEWAGGDPKLESLDPILEPCTFLACNRLTIADVLFYAAVHPKLMTLKPKKRHVLANVARWFNHIQHQLSNTTPLDIISFSFPTSNIFSIPFLSGSAIGGDAKTQKKNQKGKGGGNNDGKTGVSKATPTGSSDQKTDASTSDKAAARAARKAAKKAKKANRVDNAKGGAPVAGKNKATRLLIKVGTILSIEPHPTQPENMYVESIDVGEEEPRQVVSGIAAHVSPEHFKSKNVLCICNLKGANVKGADSNGRVLVATGADGKTKEVVRPPADAKAGDLVVLDGIEMKPDATCNSKNFSAILKKLALSSDGVFQSDGVSFITTGGACTAATLKEGKVA